MIIENEAAELTTFGAKHRNRYERLNILPISRDVYWNITLTRKTSLRFLLIDIQGVQQIRKYQM